MTQRSTQAKKIGKELQEFSRENPEIQKALRTFDLSYERYRLALEPHHFYTSTSTSSDVRSKRV